MAGFSDTVYLNSPVWMQQCAISLWGIWWYRRRFNKQFHHFAREFHERDFWTKDQFHEYQVEHFNQLIKKSLAAPYYKKAFDGLLNQYPMRDLTTLQSLPLLDKEVLRTHSKELLTAIPSKNTQVYKSSGTTGTPTEIYFEPDFHAMTMAVAESRNLNIANVSYQSRRVMFGVRKVCHFDQSHPPFWRFSIAENMAYASIYHLSPQHIPHYIDFFRSYQPEIIMGYPSALCALATFALEHDDKPPPAKIIITTSETVTSQIRNTLEAAWQCKVLDRYGAVEGCVFAGQCEHGRYHSSPEVGIVEILDEHGFPCGPGQLGEVVCTGLHNTLQPLIRYRLGDMARWSEEQTCPCGRKTPILECIEGRVEDMCLTPDGRQVLRFDTVFKGIVNIKEAQVIQETIHHFTIKIVPAVGFNENDKQRLQDNMKLHAGNVETTIVPVEKIERSASGKFRAVLCRLSKQEKNAITQAISN